ncbi:MULTISPECIES: hypothetical protein [Burkholderia]|uniref:hypothetical protein n=1 Tax=Burkholderia sp. GbtcB21 TaxID=2824766 RepID=UPI001C3031A4|nr:hypothetical protein [Burkholderia sp. GbtcB21]
MTALDVADGDGGADHEGASPAVFQQTRKMIGFSQHSATAISRNAIDLARNFILAKGAERCIKLLAAWLLRPAAPYNCRFPEQN